MREQKKTRPAGGTAERETAEKTAYKAAIPMEIIQRHRAAVKEPFPGC